MAQTLGGFEGVEVLWLDAVSVKPLDSRRAGHPSVYVDGTFLVNGTMLTSHLEIPTKGREHAREIVNQILGKAYETCHQDNYEAWLQRQKEAPPHA
jgi:hypothetical protein